MLHPFYSVYMFCNVLVACCLGSVGKRSLTDHCLRTHNSIFFYDCSKRALLLYAGRCLYVNRYVGYS